MGIKYRKLLGFYVIFTSGFLGLCPLYTQAGSPLGVRGGDAEIAALVTRNARRGRSPAFVPEPTRLAAGSETALLREAARATSAVEAAALYGAAWRLNPTKARAAELRRAFARAHPGADLSDFVVLKVADL